jgi:hypothetical protein
MSAPNADRWRFRVIELPKPMMSGVAYRWSFIGMGAGAGAVWEFALTTWFGQRRGSEVMLFAVAAVFFYHAYSIRREMKQLRKLTEDIRREANRTIGPELSDDEVGERTHEQ